MLRSKLNDLKALCSQYVNIKKEIYRLSGNRPVEVSENLRLKTRLSKEAEDEMRKLFPLKIQIENAINDLQCEENSSQECRDGVEHIKSLVKDRLTYYNVIDHLYEVVASVGD